MIRRSRIRRIAKWSGVVVCVVMVVAWVASLWARASIPAFGKSFGVGDGFVFMFMGTGAPPTPTWAMPSVRVAWLPIIADRTFDFMLLIPMWIPFLPVALSTAYLFYRDRRHPPGHCQKCGYDLQGNVSVVCPECGKAA